MHADSALCPVPCAPQASYATFDWNYIQVYHPDTLNVPSSALEAFVRYVGAVWTILAVEGPPVDY
jgi:hypothetical protein